MGKPLPTINPIARELLMSYAWPGNARELENVMERAVLLTDNEVRPEHLGIDLRIDFSSLDDIRKSLQDVSERAARSAETELIVQTLRRTFGNKSKAAALLGVSYKTLLNKVKLYELGADKEETPVEGSV
jgi:DNA-binding NtrC family response regulator